MNSTAKRQPVAFISHNHNDKPVVRRLAHALMEKGIDVFFDEWEIGPGDSIRRKVDEGLGGCTDFLVALSPHSLNSEWVQTEMDGAFVRKLEGTARFIPLRLGLTVAALPHLFRGMHSPSLDDFDACVADLVGHIYGVSKKPSLGRPPAIASHREYTSGLSPVAEAIAKLLSEGSRDGRAMDPTASPEDLLKATGVEVDDLREAVHELQQQGLIDLMRSIGDGRVGFTYVYPSSAFFTYFDPIFGIGNPIEDARIVGSLLIGQFQGNVDTDVIAEELRWDARRLNPAIDYLGQRRLIHMMPALGVRWVSAYLQEQPGLRSFVREGNH